MTQNDDGSPGTVSIYAGDCSGFDLPNDGPLDPLSSPIGRQQYRSLASMAVWDRGSRFFFAAHTSPKIKIIDGSLYTTTLTGSGTFAYAAATQTLYWTNGAVNEVIVDPSGPDGDVLVPVADEQGGPGCAAEGTALAMLRVLRQIVAQKLRIALNNRQKVIEIVCDSACQLADGLHLLGLPELTLRHLGLGDVLARTDLLVDAPALVEHRTSELADVPHLAVFRQGAVLELNGLTLPQGPIALLGKAPILRVDQVADTLVRRRAREEGVRCQAEELGMALGAVDAAVLAHVPDIVPDPRQFRGLLEPFLTLPQHLLIVLALGDLLAELSQETMVAHGLLRGFPANDARRTRQRPRSSGSWR